MSNARFLGVLLCLAGMAGCASAPTLPPRLVFETGVLTRSIVAFDSGATRLASAEADGTVTIWSIADGIEQRRWRAHRDSVHGLALLADGRIVSASYDGTIASWGDSGELLRSISTPAPITDAAIDTGADLIVTAHTDGAVRRWRLADLQLLESETRHRGRVLAVAYHAASRRFASAGRDGAVYVWRAGEAARALTPPPTDAHDLVFAPDGAQLYGAGWFKVFRWDVAHGALTTLGTEHHGAIVSLDVTRDGRGLAVISRDTDSKVQLLDTLTGAPLKRFQSHDLCGAYVRLSPDERYLATTSDDASVRIYDLTVPAPSP